LFFDPRDECRRRDALEVRARYSSVCTPTQQEDHREERWNPHSLVIPHLPGGRLDPFTPNKVRSCCASWEGTSMTIRLAAVAAASLALGGCQDSRNGQQVQTSPAPPPHTLPPGEVAVVECAAPIDLTPPVEVKVGNRVATQAGYKLTFADRDADAPLVLGVLGPVDDASENLAAIKQYLRFFAHQKADAIVLTGDVGETAKGIARTLVAVAEAGLPLLVLVGNRECRADFTNGVLEAQRMASNVVNLNQVRAVEFPEATLVSLPGFHDPSYIGCATGCLYFKSTVDEVVRVAAEARNPVVLLAHGAPRGKGPQALDYASGGGNVGDAEINRAIKEANISFGIFSHVREAGARGTDSPEGGGMVREGHASRRLYLNPGPADTVEWEMNDGTRSLGMAAVFRLEGDQASFKVYRATLLTAPRRPKATAVRHKTTRRPGRGLKTGHP
jgi:Icc-related predicted phosphoesterase